MFRLKPITPHHKYLQECKASIQSPVLRCYQNVKHIASVYSRMWTIGSLLNFVNFRRNSSKREESRCLLIYLLSRQFRSRLVLQLRPKTLQPIIGILLARTGPSSSSGTATDYGLDGPGVESPWGDFPPVQTGPGDQIAPCTTGTGSFPGVKCGLGVLLTTHCRPVPGLWKSRAIPVSTLWATPGL